MSCIHRNEYVFKLRQLKATLTFEWILGGISSRSIQKVVTLIVKKMLMQLRGRLDVTMVLIIVDDMNHNRVSFER